MNSKSMESNRMSVEDGGPGQQVVRFQNEPLTDFSRAENRAAMEMALKEVRMGFGGDYPLIINGKLVETRSRITSRNPSKPKEIIGTISCATADHVDSAVEAARRAWEQWRKVPVDHRAEYLHLIADGMRSRRFELAAWMVFECGKPWEEADGDVAEAVDFCMYYAACIRELTKSLHCDFLGEENSVWYRSRGVAAVIAPWNFPLAILTGMTVAALVTGNTVVMKPAEQSSVVAAILMDIIQEAGLPNGAVNYLPGIGSEVGPPLVGHRGVNLIAFTGSREVGLEINRRAAESVSDEFGVKRVIAEMGGKNAIIVDEDADLDEAIQGILKSAFGYAGQKCSACSRVIVLKSVEEALLQRLKAATESLKVGPAENPAVDLGPVIDEDSIERIRDYIAIGNEEATPLVAVEPDSNGDKGYFVGPHIFTGVDPESRLAIHEIFGPVLCVLTARNLDHAFTLANETDYALTGGVYSRSPVTLQRAREEFLVGNLYLNRGITGAIVQRQPFGGFAFSGIGTKAGGPDYLLQFLLPVTVTENTSRRGFAPATKES
ncbi:MAG: L-glutamate gamma-semialdehyde dehydrogenase [Planctomycetaceae bacterium]|nr:L-glutamate gamma-semialdehyde dehydrogenase [Planctomycetaceae bacterium]MCB9951631.1 L-glutamate gamma-semialdehyde dehydrogenase [Planctomycetaceae bacterium]